MYQARFTQFEFATSVNVAVTRGNLLPSLLIVVAERELRSDRFWAEAGRVDGQARVQVEAEAAVGIDMAVDQRCEAPQIVGIQAILPSWFGENLLDHKCVDVDERELDQVQRQHTDLLVVAAV